MKTSMKSAANLRQHKQKKANEKLSLTVVWEAVNTCNAKCKTCFHWQNSPDEGILNTFQAKTAIGKLADSGLTSLTLSGGEPLMRKDIPEIIRFAKLKGIEVELQTNGLLVTERQAWKLVDAGLDTVTISIDAADSELNDGLRGLSGYHSLAVEAIDNLKAMRSNGDPKIQIMVTVNNENSGQLTALADLVVNKGIDGLQFQLAQNMPSRGFHLDSSLRLDSKQREILISQIDELLERYSEILVGSPEFYLQLRHALAKFPHGLKVNPASVFSFLQMDAMGNLFPTPAKKLNLGNILQSDIGTICHCNEARCEPLEVDSPDMSCADYAKKRSLHTHKPLQSSVSKLIRPILHTFRLI